MQLKLIFLVLLLCCAMSASAQTGTTHTMRAITLDEAISLALQHNYDIQIQKINPEIASYSLGISSASYDPTFFMSAQHNYSLSPGGIDAQARTFAGNETDTDTFRAGFSGILPSGMTYTLNTSAADTHGTRPGNILDFGTIQNISTNYIRDVNNPNSLIGYSTSTNYGTTGVRFPFENANANVGAVTLTQPLLKNFWIDTTRANIYVARNQLKYSEQAFRFQLMLTVNAVEQAYYNLIFARENLKVQEAALALAQRLLDDNKKKVEVGAMAPLDEKQAESQMAASRADLLGAQRSLEQQENILKNLITDKYTEWHTVNLAPSENLIAVPEVLNLQESWQKGMKQRPDLIQARLDVDRSDINVRLDKNQLLPQLDLVGQYGYAGSGPEFSRGFGQVKGMDNPFWYYGVQLNYPIGSRAARNNYKIAKAQKRQVQLLLKQKEQDVMVEIDDAVKLVQTNFERVEATRQARTFAEAALDAEQKKLANGKSTSFFVLQFQRDLTTARFQEIRALAEYNNSLAQLAFREGTTLDRRKLGVTVK